MDIIELSKRRELDGGFYIAFEEHRQHNDTKRNAATEAGIDPHVVARYVRHQNAFLLASALSYQSLPNLEALRYAVVLFDRVSRQERQHRSFIHRVGYIKGSMLRANQRREFGKQELRNRQQVALSLHHAGEFGDVRL